MNGLEQGQRRRTLFIISFATFAGFLDTPLLIPILALYAAELGAGLGVIGLLIGLYSLVNTPANLFFGRLIDRVGYKVPLIAGLIGDALSMFLYSLSRLPVHLALVRALHGMTGALLGPATMTAFADYSGGQKKGRVMSFYGAALAAATLSGFAVSGVLASRLSYQAIFFFGAAMLVVAAGLSFLLRGGQPPGGRRMKLSLGESLKRVGDLLRRRGLIASYSAIFAQYFTFGGVVTLLPIYVKGLKMAAFQVGMLLAIFAIMFIIVQFPSGLLSDRAGRRLPTLAGLALGILSLAILPSFEVFPLLAAAMAFYGVGYGFLFPSVSALIADHTVAEEQGMATGVFHAMITAGVAIGAPVMGWLGEAVGVPLALRLVPAVMVLALVIALVTMKRM